MTFMSDDIACRGTLYRPDRPNDPALIVTASGLPGGRHIISNVYPKRLASAGYAVFDFDVRYMGNSDGTPRNHIDPAAQRDDWKAALAGLRARADIDTSQLILCGIDLGCGVAVSVAASDTDIDAVIGMMPIKSGRSFLDSQSRRYRLRGFIQGIRDKFQSVFTDPHTIPVYDTDAFSLIDVSTSYLSNSVTQAETNTKNISLPARSFFTLSRDTVRSHVTTPTVIICNTNTNDTISAPDSASSMAAEMAMQPSSNSRLLMLSWLISLLPILLLHILMHFCHQQLSHHPPAFSSRLNFDSCLSTNLYSSDSRRQFLHLLDSASNTES
jgi:Dienelactone hydrolase and related enzymes